MLIREIQDEIIRLKKILSNTYSLSVPIRGFSLFRRIAAMTVLGA